MQVTRKRDQRGQVTTALVIAVTVAVCAVAFYGVLALGRGVDERTQAQAAADAAALAGAGSFEAALPGLIGQLSSHGQHLGNDQFSCDFGRALANEYAEKNDARLVSYCFDAAEGEVRAEVEMNDRVNEDIGPARADSVASTGVNFADCEWEGGPPDPPSPTPTPTQTASPSGSPSPTPTPTPPPLPNWVTKFDCGSFSVEFEVDGETGHLRVKDIRFDVQPRLID